ncbi:MAG: UDP-N-acetylglucosamine 1-carboxyvinyltransferase [Syntrophobacteraceae bacterium]
MRNMFPEDGRLIVTGGRKLEGTVSASGSKYSAMLTLACAFLSPAGTVLRNIPLIEDVEALLWIGESLGIGISRHGQTISVEASTMENRFIPPEFTSELHSSYLILPVLASRFGEAVVGFPGGCRVDSERSTVPMTELYGAFGFEVRMDPDRRVLEVRRKDKPRGDREMDFAKVSHREITMYTKTAVLLASSTPGRTVIRRPFIGPEMRDMAELLRRMGAKIWGAGAEVMVIEGTEEFAPAECEIKPDWTESLTLLATGFLTGGRVTVDNLPVSRMGSELAALAWMGAELELPQTDGSADGTCRVSCGRGKHLQPVKLTTSPWPGLNTDSHPILAACLTAIPGRSSITEGVFSNRSVYVEHFREMNVQVECNNNTVWINGPSLLRGAPVRGHDIRTCASLLLLALAAGGESVIDEWRHLRRGYHDLPGKLRSIGGQIIESSPEKHEHGKSQLTWRANS